VTRQQLQQIMPRLPAARCEQLFPFLQAAMAEFAIDTPAREAAFAAQLAHESGQFRFMEEIWGPTDAQRRYEPASTLAARLGNSQAGDGKRFKGRGPIQITGRDNYRRYGGLLGVDLLAGPERAAAPELAFRIAALFWTKNGLNELADQATADAFRRMTRRINGGFNGLEDRERYYAAACAALGVTVGTPRGRARDVAPRRAPFARGFEAIRRDARRPRKKVRTPKRKRKQTAGRSTSASRVPRGSRGRTGGRRRRTPKS
jgi:putative chitinase